MYFVLFRSIVHNLDWYRLSQRVARAAKRDFPGQHDQAATMPVLDGIAMIVDENNFILINHGLDLHGANRHEYMHSAGMVEQQEATVKQGGGQGDLFAGIFFAAEKRLRGIGHIYTDSGCIISRLLSKDGPVRGVASGSNPQVCILNISAIQVLPFPL